MKDAPFVNLVLAAVFIVVVGWLLIVGQAIIVPILVAVISVYVMTSASTALKRLPILRLLPLSVLRFLLLVLFALALLLIATIIAFTVREISNAAPNYEANIDIFVERIADRLNLERQELWEQIRAVTIDSIDLRRLILAVLGGFTNVGSTVFLIVIYAAFLMAERGIFVAKIARGLGDPERAERVLQTVGDINSSIGDYLAAKTLVNLLLGTLCYVFLKLVGLDFALFWAVIIGLLNYIPYVGSILGSVFPVALSIAQFGSLSTTLLVTALLTAAQMFVGGIVDPRLVGRQVNLSPLVVIIALSVWTSMWGIVGAILAVPLTSILAIILGRFEQTRIFALLLAERVDGPQDIVPVAAVTPEAPVRDGTQGGS